MDIFLDVETSGLNNYKNGLWQIAALVYNNGKLVDKFNDTCKIFPDQEWDDIARDMAADQGYFDVTHNSSESLHTHFKLFLEEFINPFNRTDKLHLYAYNASFDEKFLRSFFYNNNNKYFGSYFWKPVIDVMSLAGEHLKDERDRLPNFKQGTVTKYLNIPVDSDKQHDALYDIKLMREIYKVIN